MKTIYIYCEGPTEESFINAVLYPYFLGMGIYVCPIVCETRRDANRKYRGGVSRYAKVKNELMILCKSHPHEYVTTMFDYYAMPSDTPGISDATPDIFERIGKIESIINEATRSPVLDQGSTLYRNTLTMTTKIKKLVPHRG